MAAINSLIRRASVLLRLSPQDAGLREPLADGEVIFCKNNVCVHPPTALRTEMDHHPGYLSIRAQNDEVLGSTLILTWIPNATIKKNARSLENHTPGSSPCRSARSSTCPSPTLGGSRSSHHSLHSGYSSPREGSEKSPADDFSHCICKTSLSQHRRRSISSTVSDIGSPRSDLTSLESWGGGGSEVEISTPTPYDKDFDQNSASPHLRSTWPKGSTCRGPARLNGGSSKLQSQSDSGIGPEEVTAALESMITGLDNIDVHNQKESENQPRKCSTNQEDTNKMAEDGFCCNGDKEEEEEEEKKDEDEEERLNSKNASQCAKDCIDSAPSCDSNKQGLFLVFPKGTSHLPAQCNDVPEICTTPHTPPGSSSSSTTPTTSNRDPESYPSTPPGSAPSSPLHHIRSKFLYVEGTPESLAHAHNLAFPELSASASPTPSRQYARENPCGVFSVDLSQMRSLRLFFSNKECTCGQLVVASRESQYKILHFHYGGLDKLASVFEEWNFLLKSKNTKSENCPYRQFSVCRPEVTAAECHPEEEVYSTVDDQTWHRFMNEEGQIEDDFQLRKEIFFGGLDPRLRREVWPFLLHYYRFQSTFDEREQLRNDKYIEYQLIRRKRERMSEEEKEAFWRSVQCTVEKDVIRTDRSNPFYAGDDNPNIEIMKNILLNYAVYNPQMGYTQGMSDLLAPVLAEIQDEAESFWCFVGLMQRTIFVSSPKDIDMDINLNYLRELILLMLPKFYQHLQRNPDSLELLFAHRWILLCFKREFPEQEALKMWESCWVHYQTDYFHLFICLAIISIYGMSVVSENLRCDEMLFHFSSLAMHMNGELVLRKARGLLHQFRLFPRIPCTLAKLCELCGPGMWDSGHVPIVECANVHGGQSCPHGGQDPSAKDI